MIIGGWILVGIGVVMFLAGCNSILEVEMLRLEAGDIRFWGLRTPFVWLRKAPLLSKYIEFRLKLVKDQQGKKLDNLRIEATHIAAEVAGWFAGSSFLASVGGILISLGNVT